MYQHREPERSTHPQGWRAIRHFAYLDRSFRDVRRALAAAPQQILAGPSRAGEGASAPVAELRVRRAGFDLARDVRMVIGDVEIGVHSARLPLQWEDATRPGLFPILEATLDVAPVQAGRHAMTQLGLLGRYRPPFGRLGGLADSFAGQRIVLESVEQFLDDVVARFQSDLPEPDPEPAPGPGPGPGPGSDASEPPVGDRPTPLRRRIVLPVDGLDRSPGGAAGLGLRLLAVPGVLDATVNPLTGLAVIDYDASTTTAARLIPHLEPEP